MTAVFMGHSSYYGRYNKLIESIIVEFIEQGVTEFLCGGIGGFEKECAAIIRKLKKKYSQIELCIVVHNLKGKYAEKEDYDLIIVPENIERCHFKAAITFKNKYMVDNATHAICYVCRKNGGAYQTYQYAKRKGLKIHNLSNVII